MTFIGGIFLTSRDPPTLIAWLEDRLGITMKESEGGAMYTHPVGDHIAVLAVQPSTAEALPPPPQPVIAEPYGRQAVLVNLRVENLDGVVERLQAAGDEVEGPKDYGEFGRFAWTQTPDGHDIELWQP